MTTLGATRFATIFTSCWAYGSRHECRDGAPGHPSFRLHWKPGAKVDVDLRLASQDVSITCERVVGSVAQPGDSVRLSLRPRDGSGRRWRVRLPARARRCTDLVIYARHGDRGDVAADIGLRPR